MSHDIPNIPNTQFGANVNLAVYALSILFNLAAIFVKVIAPEWASAFIEAGQLMATVAGGTAFVSNVQQRKKFMP